MKIPYGTNTPSFCELVTRRFKSQTLLKGILLNPRSVSLKQFWNSILVVIQNQTTT